MGTAKLMVKQGGVAYCIACLKEGVTEFCPLDLFLDSKEAEFIVKGNASVHLTGYLEGDDMDDEDEEEEVTKSKPAPSLKAAPVASSPKASPKASPKVEPKKVAVEEEDDDEEEEEEEEEEEKKTPVAPAAKAAKKEDKKD